MSSTKNRRWRGPAKALITLACLVAPLCWAAGAAAQVPVVGVSGKVSLKDIVGTSTLVTVVIKGSEATAPNCRVVGIGPNYFSVVSPNGDRNAYLFDSVKELRIQGGKIKHEKFDLSEDRVLTDDERDTYNKAISKAGEIFDRALANQGVRMKAAILLALNKNDKGLTYLQRLAQSNDMYTAVRANLELYLVNQANPTDQFVGVGLSSGDRRVRAETIVMVGVLKLSKYEDRLLDLVKERLADISAPAAFALGRLKSKAAIPDLLDMVGGLNERKAAAARRALVAIGGDEVIKGLKKRLPDATGLARFRLMQALHSLGDPLGERLLKDEAMNTPSISIAAAMALAKTGDFDAREKLEDKLNERYEDTPDQLIQRGHIAAVLIKSGDRRSVSVLQALLQSEDASVQTYALNTIATLGDRSLIELVVPTMSSSKDDIAVLSCQAIAAMLKPGFRERLAVLNTAEK